MAKKVSLTSNATDKTIQVPTIKTWKLACIRHGKSIQDEHGLLVVRENTTNNPAWFLVHLHASGSKVPSYASCDPFSGGKVRIEIIPLSDELGYRCYQKGDEIDVPEEDALRMLRIIGKYVDKRNIDKISTKQNGQPILDSINRSINDNVIPLRVNFNLFGQNNFLNSMFSCVTNKSYHNCISWVAYILKFAGVVIDHGQGAKFIAYKTSDILLRPARKPSLAELFLYIKEGNTDCLLRYFPPETTNMSFLVEGGLLARQACHLGHYSPLMIAVSFNQYETAKLLIERYSASVNQLGGRYRDHSPLDIAVNTKNESVQQLLIHNNALPGHDVRRSLQKVCQYIKRDNLSALKEFLREHPFIDLSSTISDATFGLTESYLGAYSPLLLACINNNIDIVKYLFNTHEVRVNELNGRGLNYTVLDYSNQYSGELRQYLIDNGAKPAADIKQNITFRSIVEQAVTEISSTDNVKQNLSLT